MAGEFGRRKFFVAGAAAAGATVLASRPSYAATSMAAEQAISSGTSTPTPRGNLMNNSSFENAAPGAPVPGWTFF
ncbi:MAG: hypothetical protein WCI12_04485 [Actinomycetes bacterium]